MLTPHSYRPTSEPLKRCDRSSTLCTTRSRPTSDSYGMHNATTAKHMEDTMENRDTVGQLSIIDERPINGNMHRISLLWR